MSPMVVWFGEKNRWFSVCKNGGFKHWLVVSNMFFSIIYGIIRPIDEYFSRLLKPPTRTYVSFHAGHELLDTVVLCNRVFWQNYNLHLENPTCVNHCPREPSFSRFLFACLPEGNFSKPQPEPCRHVNWSLHSQGDFRRRRQDSPPPNPEALAWGRLEDQCSSWSLWIVQGEAPIPQVCCFITQR